MLDRAASLMFLLSMMLFSTASAGEEDYLEALELEAEKLSAVSEAIRSGPEGTQETAAERRRFETDLEKHKGTYSLYRKLREKDKAEIFKAYREGASISRIRRMVIDRRMHR